VAQKNLRHSICPDSVTDRAKDGYLKKIRPKANAVSLLVESLIILGGIVIVPLFLMSTVRPQSFLSVAPDSNLLASRTGEKGGSAPKPEIALEMQEAAVQREDFATLFRAEDASEALMESDARMENVDDFEGGSVTQAQ
jgi:hypothetical protein